MHPFKVVVVGDENVGKTSFVKQCVENLITSDYEPTLLDNYTKIVQFNGKAYTFQLWDTPGQTDYSRIRYLSYKLVDCFVICYSVDSKLSYQNVRTKWLKEVKQTKSKIPIILVGTKVDLRINCKSECLSEEDGLKLKKKIKAKSYLECSSLSSIQADYIFQEIAMILIKRKMNKKNTCAIF